MFITTDCWLNWLNKKITDNSFEYIKIPKKNEIIAEMTIQRNKQIEM